MRPEQWHIIVAGAVLAVIVTIVHRWSRRIFFGLYGLAIIILPTVTWYLEGRLSLWWAINILASVLLLCADLTGKLPGRDTIRRKVLGKKASNLPQ